MLGLDQWASINHFSREEFVSPDTKTEDMDYTFMYNLDGLRGDCGFPFRINSGWRSPNHNHLIGGAEHSPHLEGLAVDIAVWGKQAFVLLDQISKFNAAQITPYFTGIGIAQRGAVQHRFVHVDAARPIDSVRPRPWVWTYS